MFGKTRNRKRKEPFMRSNKRGIVVFVKTSLAIAAVSISLYCGYLVFVELKQDPYLEVTAVVINGGSRLNDDEVLKISGIHKGMNILTISSERGEESLKAHPFVKSAAIKKIFPDRVDITIEERKPVAIVNINGLYLMDDAGVLFKKYSYEDNLDLPLVTGFDKLEEKEDVLKGKLLKFISTLKEGAAFDIRGVSEIYVDKFYGFSLVTIDDGVRIEFGVDGFEDKLSWLEKIIEARSGTFAGIEAIDLNNVRGAVVKFATTRKQGGIRWQKETI